MNTDAFASNTRSHSHALAALLRLSSPALPVGAFSYSQGLEYAHEGGWLRDEPAATDWLSGVMQHSIAALDLPVLIRCHLALQEGDIPAFHDWNTFCIASRETRELRLEDTQMGAALLKLLRDLDEPMPCTPERSSWPAAFALAAHTWQIPLADSCTGYLWSWLENQLAAAAKIVPLGQTSVQRLLARLSANFAGCIASAMACNDDEIGSSAPGLAIASMLHETQYTRLFRS